MSEVTEAPATEVIETAEPDAAAPAPKADATPAEKRMFKLKIDQKEEDFDEETVIRMAQKGRAADKRFEEASKMRKDVERIMNTLDNPKEALQQLMKRNPAYRQEMENLLAEQLEEEILTPEQKEAKRFKQEYEELKREKEERTKKDADAEIDALTKKAIENIQAKIIPCLQRAKLSENLKTTSRIANIMSAIRENQGISYADMDIQEIVDFVKDEVNQDVKSVTDGMDARGLIDLLGKDKINLIRKHFMDAAKVSGNAAPAPKADNAPAPKQDDGKRKFIGIREANRLMPS